MRTNFTFIPTGAYSMNSPRVCCTIHETRTDMCREYGCWRLLILDRSGIPVGRITGPRILRTKDDELIRLWEEEIASLSPSDQERWDNQLEEILCENGFSLKK